MKTTAYIGNTQVDVTYTWQNKGHDELPNWCVDINTVTYNGRDITLALEDEVLDKIQHDIEDGTYE